jgi:hypothetical protein
VNRAAEQEPEKFADVRDEMNRSGKVNAAYAQVRRHERHEDIVQITIACCAGRIGEELKKIPKATYKGGAKKQSRPEAKKVSEKEATGIKKDQRSRFGKLADLGMEKVEEISRKLQAHYYSARPFPFVLAPVCLAPGPALRLHGSVSPAHSTEQNCGQLINIRV